MKILFFGRGVIGTQYAWAFEKAGHTVEFYVREGRKEQYGTHVNLNIWDARRGKKDRIVKEKWPIVTHEEIKENHDYDLVFLFFKI
jgi:2-dehydropantoate 2-reductase